MRELTKVCTSSWVAYWVRYGLILRMLYSAKRHDLETEAMWTPRFLAVLDGTRDKESVLILMLWWMTCLVQLKVVIFHPCGYISKTVRDPRRDRGVLRRERQKQLRSEEHTSALQSHLNLV